MAESLLAIRTLDRVRRVLGDLFIAADYPGGPKAMHADLLKAENHIDRLSERTRFAMLVLDGGADDYVQAYFRRHHDRDETLCDHCKDLSARFLRAGRDAALADARSKHEDLARLLQVVRNGLRARGLLRPKDAYDFDALLERLGAFFAVFDFTAAERAVREEEAGHG
jgi:hypothetical protein